MYETLSKTFNPTPRALINRHLEKCQKYLEHCIKKEATQASIIGSLIAARHAPDNGNRLEKAARPQSERLGTHSTATKSGDPDRPATD